MVPGVLVGDGKTQPGDGELMTTAKIVIGISADMVGRIDVAELARRVSAKMNGRGGGARMFAEGSGRADLLDAALVVVPSIVEELLRKDGNGDGDAK